MVDKGLAAINHVTYFSSARHADLSFSVQIHQKIFSSAAKLHTIHSPFYSFHHQEVRSLRPHDAYRETSPFFSAMAPGLPSPAGAEELFSLAG